MEIHPTLAVIGGSGLYHMSGLENLQEIELDTPFGKPSAPIATGTLQGQTVAFLARHGLGHHITPTEVNYRANIFALKLLGVQRIVSSSACGSPAGKMSGWLVLRMVCQSSAGTGNRVGR